MRLFIGIPVPADLCQQIRSAWETLPQRPCECRAIDPALWHLTLAFLGEIDGRILPELSELVAQSMTTPPEGHFVLGRFQTFPPRRPTLLVASADIDQREAWNRYVENMRDLVSMLAPQIDRKPWHPHITIARSKKRTQRLPLWQHAFNPVPWKPEQIALVHSALTATGPTYTHLEKFPIDGLRKYE